MIASVLASWSEPSPWFAIAIAAVALIAAIVYPARANHIAAKALALSEAEAKARDAERKARARLAVEPRILVHKPDADGLLLQDGSGGQLRLEIAIRNDGTRDAGRGKIEVTFPEIVSDTGIRWTNGGGHELADSERAGRVGETNVISRAIEGVPRDLPERLYLHFPISVPQDDDTIYDYPIGIRVAAEGADAAHAHFPLRVARRRPS